MDPVDFPFHLWRVKAGRFEYANWQKNGKIIPVLCVTNFMNITQKQQLGRIYIYIKKNKSFFMGQIIFI